MDRLWEEALRVAKKYSAGAKARFIFLALSARLNSLVKKSRFRMKMKGTDLPGLKPDLIPLALCGG
jgi:hypothetical protein